MAAAIVRQSIHIGALVDERYIQGCFCVVNDLLIFDGQAAAQALCIIDGSLELCQGFLRILPAGLCIVVGDIRLAMAMSSAS